MRSLKRPGRGNRDRTTAVAADFEPQDFEAADDGDEDSTHETYEMFRVTCPDCARPIALLADEEVLPEHALCPSPWNPFGLTVCPGTGRNITEATPADDSLDAQEQDAALLLTLPQSLDWRTQPFSHIGGPGSRPFRLPPMRHRA
ncbi:hypothetical protein [Streptomyces albus]|uniref:hypothetical protein n=1 Tax=Streptomyces albus TaxID=1888 RepID=UPI0004C5D489|nr:hypothetical protein [Streptomyces albus]